MDWPQIAGLLISGGIVKALLDVAAQGWRDQAAVRGRRLTERDQLLRSRLVWMEAAYAARRVALSVGATQDDLGDLPDDPYDDRP